MRRRRFRRRRCRRPPARRFAAQLKRKLGEMRISRGATTTLVGAFVFVACSRTEPVQPIIAQDAATPVATNAPDAAAMGEADASGARASIGYEGGTFEGDGVR